MRGNKKRKITLTEREEREKMQRYFERKREDGLVFQS